MRLQEALFLSSLKKAVYEHGLASYGTAYRCYRIIVEIKEEVSQDRFKQSPERTRTLFVITVSRREGKTVYPPHATITTYSLDDCLDELAKWTVGEEYEHPWQPVEEWEPKPVTKQTDLAEKILSWIKRNKEQIPSLSAGSEAKLLEIFLVDVENLCNEYLKDVQP